MESDQHVDWREGEFAGSRELVKSRIKQTGFPMSNVHLIEGFYENSLTPELLNDLKSRKIFPPLSTSMLIILSTKTVIDWLDPLLRVGCVFHFDDIWSFHGNPNMGQLKYINEFNSGSEGRFTPIVCMGWTAMPSFIQKRNGSGSKRGGQSPPPRDVAVSAAARTP